MPITGINYRFLVVSSTSDTETTAAIPFTGDGPVITRCKRSSYETAITRFSLTEETINQYRALIDKYYITEWTDKAPAPPKLIEDGKTGILSEITLLSDDGTNSRITFREVPEDIGNQASEEFRKLFIESTSTDRKISDEMQYPTLKECLKLQEEHGPVTAVETVSSSSGMMYGSNKTVRQKLKKVSGKDNAVVVTVEKQAGNLPAVSDSKEISSDVFTKLQELSDRENIPVWNYACKDPSIPVDTSMMPTDYSSSYSITVIYDDSLLSGCPSVRRTIGKTACEMGGGKIIDMISEMVNECVSLSGVNVEMPDAFQNPVSGAAFTSAPVNAFAGMGMLNINKPSSPEPDTDGTWTCKDCGKTGLTTKFCTECGFKRP